MKKGVSTHAPSQARTCPHRNAFGTPEGACFQAPSCIEIVRFVMDGGQSSQIRFWSELNSHSFYCGTKRLKHKRQPGASRFEGWESGAEARNKAAKGQGRPLLGFPHCSPHHPLAPGTSQAALMSLERSDARIENLCHRHKENGPSGEFCGGEFRTKERPARGGRATGPIIRVSVAKQLLN